jgi:hypothetical protein
MSTSLEQKHEADESEIMAQITVTVYRSGAMSVAGDIHDETFALTLIDAARDSVKSHHLRQHGQLIIPAGSARLS